MSFLYEVAFRGVPFLYRITRGVIYGIGFRGMSLDSKASKGGVIFMEKPAYIPSEGSYGIASKGCHFIWNKLHYMKLPSEECHFFKEQTSEGCHFSYEIAFKPQWHVILWNNIHFV